MSGALHWSAVNVNSMLRRFVVLMKDLHCSHDISDTRRRDYWKCGDAVLNCRAHACAQACYVRTCIVLFPCQNTRHYGLIHSIVIILTRQKKHWRERYRTPTPALSTMDTTTLRALCPTSLNRKCGQLLPASALCLHSTEADANQIYPGEAERLLRHDVEPDLRQHEDVLTERSELVLHLRTSASTWPRAR